MTQAILETIILYPEHGIAKFNLEQILLPNLCLALFTMGYGTFFIPMAFVKSVTI